MNKYMKTTTRSVCIGKTWNSKTRFLIELITKSSPRRYQKNTISYALNKGHEDFGTSVWLVYTVTSDFASVSNNLSDYGRVKQFESDRLS